MIKNSVKSLSLVTKSKKYFLRNYSLSWNVPKYIELDINYICNKQNTESIANNIENRKGIGDIKAVSQLKIKLDSIQAGTRNYETMKKKFYEELLKIPNRTHPEIFSYGSEPKLVKNVNIKKEFTFKPLEFYEISKRLNLVRTDHLGNVSGSRSYYLLGEMAELEQALINYFLERLIQNNFQLVSVPDILPRDIIESCGMNTQAERNQVYTLDSDLYGPDLCLSGTSEIGLAGYLTNKIFSEEELPLQLAAVSRCYRAETSSVAEERGIFRVHEFTKVEMFIVTTPENSDAALEDIRTLQEDNFRPLDLHFQVLDMPPQELGAQAYRKYDIEAWMPGRGLYGEISSCSNCTDFQSRRLGIKYKTNNGISRFVHTLNGTACAIPRLLIALTETGQDNRGKINIPIVLHRFLREKSTIGRQKKVPELQLVKNKKNKDV